VAGILAGEERAGTQLYTFCNRYSRVILYRSLGNRDIEDYIHNVYLNVFRFILDGKVKHPEYLRFLVSTVTRREILRVVKLRAKARNLTEEYDDKKDCAPWLSHTFLNECEKRLTVSDRAKLVKNVLKRLTNLQREILLRFYVEEQPWREIADSLGLSHTNFRLRKSRAKERFGVLGKQLMLVPLKNLIRNA